MMSMHVHMMGKNQPYGKSKYSRSNIGEFRRIFNLKTHFNDPATFGKPLSIGTA